MHSSASLQSDNCSSNGCFFFFTFILVIITVAESLPSSFEQKDAAVDHPSIHLKGRNGQQMILLLFLIPGHQGGPAVTKTSEQDRWLQETRPPGSGGGHGFWLSWKHPRFGGVDAGAAEDEQRQVSQRKTDNTGNDGRDFKLKDAF